jgi:hypothetical protein
MGYKNQSKPAGLAGSPGFLVLKPGVQHNISVPNFKELTQFRVFPTPKPEGGWQSIRLSADQNDFCDSVWSEQTIRRFGPFNAITALTALGDENGEPLSTGSARSLFEMAANALFDICENHPRDTPEAWDGWTKGAANRGPTISKPKSSIFFQGAEIMIQGKRLTNASGQPAPRFPSVMMGAVSLQISFERMANDMVEGAKLIPLRPDTDEQARIHNDQQYAAAFSIGDWCSLSGGRIMQFVGIPASGERMASYAVEMMEPLPLDSIAEQIRTHHKPWSQLLRYLTPQQQMDALVKALPPEAIDFVFRSTEYQDLMPDRVKGTWGSHSTGQVSSVPMQSALNQIMAQMGQQPGLFQNQPQPYGQPSVQQAQPPVQQAQPPVQQAQPPVQQSQPPVQQAQPPVQQSQPPAQSPSGWDLGGGVVNQPAVDMQQPAYGTAAEMQQAPAPQAQGHTAPASQQQQPLQQPQQQVPVNPPQGTPSSAIQGGQVDADVLAEQLRRLNAQRRQAADGNPGS